MERHDRDAYAAGVALPGGEAGLVAGREPLAWAGSDLTPMVGTLPARARSDSLAP